jgi:hypothetical protein
MVPILVLYWLQLLNSDCRTTIAPFPLADTRTVREQTAFVSAYVLHFKSHGHIATVVAKHERLDVDQNNAELIPLNQYQLDYQRQSWLTPCHRMCVCMCTSRSFDFA